MRGASSAAEATSRQESGIWADVGKYQSTRTYYVSKNYIPQYCKQIRTRTPDQSMVRRSAVATQLIANEN